MLILIIAVMLLGLVWQLRAWFASSQRDCELFDAQQSLNAAQGKILFGRPAEAEEHLLSALAIASKYSIHFMISDGLYSLAEARESLGDVPGAVIALQVSVLHMQHWEDEKPAFARLQRNKLSELLAKQARDLEED